MNYDEAEKFTLINNIQESVDDAGNYFDFISLEWRSRVKNATDRCHKGDYKELNRDILWLNELSHDMSYLIMKTQKECVKLITLLEFSKYKKSESNTIIK